MTKPDGLDQSWGFADPAEAQRAGVEVVAMYLSHDPSKNVTAAKVKAYHQHGIAVILNWESQAGAPLGGAAPGHLDATEAVRQVKALIAAVGYLPQSKLAIPFSCDRDVNSGQYAAIDAYYGATKTVVHQAGMLNGVYGEADVCDHLHGKGLTDMEWQTYAWSGGRLSPEADFYQYQNSMTMAGASVDFDRIIHAAQLGAWWPPGHVLNNDHPTTGALMYKIARLVVANALRAVLSGGDHGYFTHKRFPYLISKDPGQGINDRLARLEKKVG